MGPWGLSALWGACAPWLLCRHPQPRIQCEVKDPSRWRLSPGSALCQYRLPSPRGSPAGLGLLGDLEGKPGLSQPLQAHGEHRLLLCAGPRPPPSLTYTPYQPRAWEWSEDSLSCAPGAAKGVPQGGIGRNR